MKSSNWMYVVLLLVASVALVHTQQSDFETKERFRMIYDGLKSDIDSATTIEQMAEIPSRINSLESEFGAHRKLITGAFYPKTFEMMISELRSQFALAQAKNTTIQVQGSRIVELEGLLVTLTSELDKLKIERDALLTQLQSTKHSLAVQRELVKQLNANLAANEKLVGALIDSVFLPFGKNMNALSEVEKDALGKNLEKVNMLNRISGIARDNVAFLSATKLEAKDYSVLVGQYEQFQRRWDGLKDKVIDAMSASNALAASQTKNKKGIPPPTDPREQAAQVDAAVAEWRSKLDGSFWASLTDEFTKRGVLVQPFNDAKSFSASIRSYVESSRASGADTRVFVDEIWIQRIDRDWRSALESQSMLGKVEYAALDKAVSQLHKERFNWQIVFWVFNVIAVVVVGWWFLTRKPKRATQAQQQEPATAKPNA